MSQGRGAGGATMGDDMDVIPEREMKVRGGREQGDSEGTAPGGEGVAGGLARAGLGREGVTDRGGGRLGP